MLILLLRAPILATDLIIWAGYSSVAFCQRTTLKKMVLLKWVVKLTLFRISYCNLLFHFLNISVYGLESRLSYFMGTQHLTCTQCVVGPPPFKYKLPFQKFMLKIPGASRSRLWWYLDTSLGVWSDRAFGLLWAFMAVGLRMPHTAGADNQQ